ncbi:MAG: hypothetical protein ACYS9X_28350 [Planctomycetota bacterium]
MRIAKPFRIAIVCVASLTLAALVSWHNFYGSAGLYVVTDTDSPERAPIRLTQTMGWPLRMYEFEEWSHTTGSRPGDHEVTTEVCPSRYAEIYDKVPCCVSGSDERWLPLGVAANILVALALSIGAPSVLAWALSRRVREPTP